MSKIKKQIVNRRILKKKLFHIYIYILFLKELLEFSRNRW